MWAKTMQKIVIIDDWIFPKTLKVSVQQKGKADFFKIPVLFCIFTVTGLDVSIPIETLRNGVLPTYTVLKEYTMSSLLGG